MTENNVELAVPKRHSFSDPNTALKFRDLLKDFAEGIIQDAAVKDRYGYILDITQDGPEFPSSTIQYSDQVDESGNPIDPVVAPNSIDNPERASYATVITDDGFKIRARIATTIAPAFRKAEFFDKFNPSGEGVMIDERGVYVYVINEGGISVIHPSSFPWLSEQNGQQVVTEPQVAPRVHVSGKAGQYYVVAVLRGETTGRIDLEYAKRDIIKNVADLQQARYDLDQAVGDLSEAQLAIDAAEQAIMDSQTDLQAAMNEAAEARAAADLATGASSQASQDAADAWNKAVDALASADGRNSIIRSTGDAEGTTHPFTGLALVAGDTWEKLDGADTRNVIATWSWDGDAWLPQTIRSEMIHNLDVSQLTADVASFTLAVVEKLVADLGVYQVLTTDHLFAGDADINNLVAQKFAAGLADIIKARIENLTVTEGANINYLVVQKIAAEVVNSGEFKTLINETTGRYSKMDSDGFSVIDTDGLNNEGDPEEVINLGPKEGQLLQLGSGRDKVIIDSFGGGSFSKLDTREFRLNGTSIGSMLLNYPRGVIAHGVIPRGLSTVRRQARAIIMGVDALMSPGRVYSIRTNQLSVARQSTNCRPIPMLHMTLDGTDPSLNWDGTAVAEAPGLVNVQTQSISHPGMEAIVDLRHLDRNGPSLLCRIAVTLNDQNNVGWVQGSTGRGAFYCIVRDEGVDFTNTGVVWLDDNVTPPAPPTRRTKRYYATELVTYIRSGGRDDSSGPTQGRYSSWNRETFIFYPSMTGDLAGATIHSVKAHSYFSHWYNNAGGTGSWCWHGHTSVPAGGTQFAHYMRDEPGWPRNAGRWAEMIPGDFGGWKSGARRGIAFSTANTSLEFYGKLSTNLNDHWIDVEYSK